MAHSKNKILLIVEGAKAEPNLMNRYKEALNTDELSIEIISFKTNIYVLYQTIKKLNYDFNNIDTTDTLDVLKDIFLHQGRMEEAEQLNAQYPYIYLLFDLDLQDSHRPNKKEIVKEMMDYFSDETDHGLLLIDYPMVEAFRDYHKPAPDPLYKERSISIHELTNYKHIVKERGNTSKLYFFGKKAFIAILKQNLMKANQIVNSAYTLPNYEDFQKFTIGKDIFQNEFQIIEKEEKIMVLCTALFIYPYYFGKEYYEKNVLHNQ